jgi:hypothetical protein
MLTRSQKARGAGAVFAVFLIFTAFFAAFLGSGIPVQRTPSTSQPAHENEVYLYRFWEWAAKDAITVYTFLLAIFTGALARISIVQIHYLRRADQTAQTAANAARSSAETARQCP